MANHLADDGPDEGPDDDHDVYLVIYLPGSGTGSVSGVFSRRARAEEYAGNIGGVVLTLPIIADYRRHVPASIREGIR